LLSVATALIEMNLIDEAVAMAGDIFGSLLPIAHQLANRGKRQGCKDLLPVLIDPADACAVCQILTDFYPASSSEIAHLVSEVY
jgi:hypothetical protein